jgi:hypothetical protein
MKAIKAKSREALTECQTSDYTNCFARWHDRWARSKAPGRQWSWQPWSECKCCHGEIKCVPTPSDRTSNAPSAAACTVPHFVPQRLPQTHLWGAWWFPGLWAVCQHSSTHFPCWRSHQTPHKHLGSKTRVASWHGCNATTCSRCVSSPKSAVCGYGYTVLTGPLHYKHFKRLRGRG